MSRFAWLSSLSLCLALVAGAPVHADISGTVFDSSGSPDPTPVEGAIVTVQTTEIQAVTDALGNFTLEGTTGTDLVIVAGKKFFFYGAGLASDGDTGVELFMDPVPQDDSEDYFFQSPVLCGFCHETAYDQWEVSPMGNTGLNEWVYDLYNGTGTVDGMNGFVYTEDSIHAVDDPNADCASCHQPIRWIDEGGGVAMGDIENPTTSMTRAISCDVCHKIADVDVDRIMWPGTKDGAATVTRPPGPPYEQVLYGRLGDVDFNDPFNMRGSYQPQMGAEMCGVCHEDNFDPNLESNYDGPDAVVVQSTYSEWKDSVYGDPASDDYQDCASCHMPTSDAAEVYLCNVIDLPRPGTQTHDHDIRGTTPGYLENAVSMTMDVTVGATLDIEVAITNDQTGHHVPTGVPLRNMVLLVEATVGGETLVHIGDQLVSDFGGVGDPAEGNYSGLPGKVFARIHEDVDGTEGVFYTEATGVAYDTRIPAMETDTTNYSFELPINEATVDVRARLIYRRAIPSVLADKGWTETGTGGVLHDIEAPHYGFLMEETTAAVEFTPPAFVFRRGDCDGDGSVTPILDALYLLEFGFVNGTPPPCRTAADVDGNDAISPIIDALYLLDWAFIGGPEPVAPGTDSCGPDNSDDDLGCETPPSC